MPKADTKPMTATIASGAVQVGSCRSSAKVSSAEASAIASMEKRRSGRLPSESISSTEMMVTMQLATFMLIATSVHVSSERPFCLRKLDEKLKALLMPDSCWMSMSSTVVYSALRTAGLVAAAWRIGSSGLESGPSSSKALLMAWSARLLNDGMRPPPNDDDDDERESGPGWKSREICTAFSMQKSSSCTCSSSGGRSRRSTSISSAMVSLPYMAYQRGDSSSTGWRSSWRSATGSTSASIVGHVPVAPRTLGRPRTCAMSMPSTIVSWLMVPHVPRR
mmetsp:Transcript_33939/g.89277  ORF Transcript_33939/g.89277 Transcript_33939/m.89277 type:complete len:278 (+) Transcript_33939:373-1206(+)